MRVRKLDTNGDMTFGRGAANFYVNDRLGVGQIARTRLGLNVGDWFLNTSEGTPWRTQVLGLRTDATRDPSLRARLLGTPGVTSLDTYASQLARQTRDYSVQAVLNTVYGRTLVATSTPASIDQDVRYAR